MRRPSETPAREPAVLTDREAADWLDAHPRAALLFWDAEDDASRRTRARLELVAAAADVPVGVVDVRANALVAQALGVASVPTVILFRGGDVVDRVMGTPPESVLADMLRGAG